MLGFLQSVWNWEVAPIPICTALLLYFVPIYWRKYRSDVYTPLYFSVYPLAKLNVPLSRYLGQSFIDDYIDNSDAEREKKIIKIKSVFSSILYVVIVPFMLSVIWSFILTREQFILSTIVVLVSVIVRFSQSIINFSRYTMVSRRGLLSFFYACVSFVFFYILLRAHYWIVPLIESKSYWKIVTTVGDFIINDVIISIVIVGGLIPIIISLAFDKKVRQTNIEKNYRSWQEETEEYTNVDSG